jgi:nitronate monooxygenase
MWTNASRFFCSKFNLEFPIIQAPMAGGPTTPELVAAVSSAGALGSIGGGYLSPESLRKSIRGTKQLTTRPFSVNLFAETQGGAPVPPSTEVQQRLSMIAKDLGISELSFTPDVSPLLERQVEVLCEEGVAVVSVTFGLLDDSQVERLRASGAKLIATATTTREALEIENRGYDAVVLQGFEAGGHRGSFTDEAVQGIGLLALLSQAARAVQLPCIASGGIMDGRAIAACLLLGSAAVQLGTAFLAVDESGADAGWKERLLASADTDTVMTKAFSGKLARGIQNEFIRKLRDVEEQVAPYPVQNFITVPIRTAARNIGNTGYLSMWSGQASSLARKGTAAGLVRRLADEVKIAFRDLRSQTDFF